jgi:hypothetical protein
MFTPARRALVALASITLAVAGVAAATPASAATHRPGPVGASIVLDSGREYSGYDVAADAAGTAYIGWIADTATLGRAVHLCTLPVNATKCSGGEQVIDSKGASSASGLRVLATSTGQVTLVWFHDTTASVDGPQNAEIAEATANQGLHLTPASDVASAPSFGSLLDAEYGPGGAIWTIAYPPSLKQTIQVRKGLTASTYTNVHTPWSIGYAQLAFSHGTPIIAAEKAGAITTAPAYATTTGSSWTAFHSLTGTWAVGTDTALVSTGRGVRLVTAVNNSSYRPVLSKWTGSAFSHRALTVDHNSCAPSTHDGYADDSGRFVDVSRECQQLTVASYADDAHAAIVRFGTKDTLTYAPQIASGASGIATVAWSTETNNGSSPGSTLRVTRVRVADATRAVTKRGRHGRVVLTGPISCLPVSAVAIHVAGHAKKHWHVVSRSMHLGSRLITGSSLDGATLTAGTSYVLHGKVVLRRGSHHSKIKTRLSFRTCPTT